MLGWFNRLLKGQVTIFFVALFGFMLLLVVVLLDLSTTAMKKTGLDIIVDNAALYLGSSLASQAKVLSDMNVSGDIYHSNTVGGFWSGWLGMVVGIIVIIIAIVAWIITSYISSGSTTVFGAGLVGQLVAAVISLAIVCTLRFGSWMVSQNLTINNVVQGWASAVATFANGTDRMRETTLMSILPMLVGDSQTITDKHDFNRNTDTADSVNRFSYYYSQRLNKLVVSDWGGIADLANQPGLCRAFLIVEGSLSAIKSSLVDLRDLITKNYPVYVPNSVVRLQKGLWGAFSGLGQPIVDRQGLRQAIAGAAAAGFTADANTQRISAMAQDGFSYFSDPKGVPAISLDPLVLPAISTPNAAPNLNGSSVNQLKLNYTYPPGTTSSGSGRSFVIWTRNDDHAVRGDCSVPVCSALPSACFEVGGGCISSCRNAQCSTPAAGSSICTFKQSGCAIMPSCAANDSETKLPLGYDRTKVSLLSHMIWDIMSSSKTRLEGQLAGSQCVNPGADVVTSGMSTSSLAGFIYSYIKPQDTTAAGLLQVSSGGTYYGPDNHPEWAIKCNTWGAYSCADPVTTALLQTKDTWIPKLLNIADQDTYDSQLLYHTPYPEPLWDFVNSPPAARADLCGQLLYGENWIQAWIGILEAFQPRLQDDIRLMAEEKNRLDQYVQAHPSSAAALAPYQAALTLHDQSKVDIASGTAGGQIQLNWYGNNALSLGRAVLPGSISCTVYTYDSHNNSVSEVFNEDSAHSRLVSAANSNRTISVDYQTGNLTPSFTYSNNNSPAAFVVNYRYSTPSQTGDAIDNINCLLADINTLLVSGQTYVKDLNSIYNTIHTQRKKLEDSLKYIAALSLPYGSGRNIGEALYVWKDADMAGGGWHMAYAMVQGNDNVTPANRPAAPTTVTNIPDARVKTGTDEEACDTKGYAWLEPYATMQDSNHPEKGLLSKSTFGPWIWAAKWDDSMNLAGWQMYNGPPGAKANFNTLKTSLVAAMANRAKAFDCNEDACNGGMLLMPQDESGGSDSVFNAALNFLRIYGVWSKSHVKVGFASHDNASGRSIWQVDIDKAGSDQY